MTPSRARPGTGDRAALLVGLVAAFVAAVDLVRWARPGLLLDEALDWAPARLLLGLAVAAGAGAAGVLAGGAFRLWSAMPRAAEPLEPLPLGPGILTAIAAMVILGGASLRFAALARVPSALWVDDLSMIHPALALAGNAGDFSDTIRPAPFGVAKPYGTIGVLYLEGYRAALRLWGTTVFGVRFPSAAAGAASLVTAVLLGRALLPAGGGALAALILAGMRWHLILSRWGWAMIALAPVVDLAALALVMARRRRTLAPAILAGALAGLGAHIYLSAWPAAAALLVFCFWPADPPERLAVRVARAAAFVVGLALLAAPLFLFREGRVAPYFARAADHNVFLEMSRMKSILPPFAAAADALAAPWFLADPTARHDLPGRMRLGWLLGIPVAIAFGRALLRPRDALSGILLTQAFAAICSTVAGGQADNPNGSRFVYLASLTAVAAAAGTLWLVGLSATGWRRAAALAAIGALAVGGAIGARDALVVWPASAATFDGFHGQDTLIGRAAVRWSRFGRVAVSPGLGRSELAITAIRSYELDPDPGPVPQVPGRFRVRIVAPDLEPEAGERVVERVRDGRGRSWAVVLARRS